MLREAALPSQCTWRLSTIRSSPGVLLDGRNRFPLPDAPEFLLVSPGSRSTARSWRSACFFGDIRAISPPDEGTSGGPVPSYQLIKADNRHSPTDFGSLVAKYILPSM